MAETTHQGRRGVSPSPPRGGSNGRTKASLEAELDVVHQELADVDRWAARNARHVDSARFLLVIVACVCLVYAFALTSMRRA
jgi:hypothetical protein